MKPSVKVFKVDYDRYREYREEQSPYDGFINLIGEDSGSTTEKEIITYDIPNGYKALVWRLKFFADQPSDVTIISRVTTEAGTTDNVLDKIKGKTEYDDDHERLPIYVIDGNTLVVKYVQGTAGNIFIRLVIQLVKK